MTNEKHITKTRLLSYCFGSSHHVLYLSLFASNLFLLTSSSLHPHTWDSFILTWNPQHRSSTVCGVIVIDLRVCHHDACPSIWPSPATFRHQQTLVWPSLPSPSIDQRGSPQAVSCRRPDRWPQPFSAVLSTFRERIPSFLIEPPLRLPWKDFKQAAAHPWWERSGKRKR